MLSCSCEISRHCRAEGGESDHPRLGIHHQTSRINLRQRKLHSTRCDYSLATIPTSTPDTAPSHGRYSLATPFRPSLQQAPTPHQPSARLPHHNVVLKLESAHKAQCIYSPYATASGAKAYKTAFHRPRRRYLYLRHIPHHSSRLLPCS